MVTPLGSPVEPEDAAAVDAAGVEVPELRGQLRVRDYGGGAEVRDYLPQPLHGRGGVRRHIGPARVERGAEALDHGCALRQPDHDRRAAAAAAQQAARRAAGARPQLGIAEALRLVRQGAALTPEPRRPLQQAYG